MTEDFKIVLERAEGCILFHCEVFRWNAQVLRELRQIVDRIRGEHREPLVATTALPADGDFDKHAKFCRMIGFKYHSIIPGLTVFGFQPLYIAE